MPNNSTVDYEARLRLIEYRQDQIDEKLNKIDEKLDKLIGEPLDDAKHYKKLIMGQVITWVAMVFVLGFVCWIKTQM